MNHWKLFAGVVLATVALGAGCGKKDPKAMSKEEVVEAMKGMMNGMLSAMKDNKDDCDKMAGALEPVLADMGPVAERAKELGKDPANQKFFEEKGKEMKPDEAAMKDLIPAMMKCKDNEKMKKLSEKMDMF